MADENALLAEPMDLAALVGVRLSERRWKLATAESCTGGLVAAAITAISGSSAWFERGFVTYSNESKFDLLGVPETIVASHGAVSEATARAMAEGALAHSRAKMSIAITGIAGPGGAAPGKPVGTVCFAWAAADESGGFDVQTETVQFYGDRAAVRAAAVVHALTRLLDRLGPGIALSERC